MSFAEKLCLAGAVFLMALVGAGAATLLRIEYLNARSPAFTLPPCSTKP